MDQREKTPLRGRESTGQTLIVTKLSSMPPTPAHAHACTRTHTYTHTHNSNSQIFIFIFIFHIFPILVKTYTNVDTYIVKHSSVLLKKINRLHF